MADLEVTYKNLKIIEMSESGAKTLETQGKYCEDNITINYTKSETAKSFIILKSQKGALLTCGNQTYQLVDNETEHSFMVDLGTYEVSATLNGRTTNDTVLVDIIGVYEINLVNLIEGYTLLKYIGMTGRQYINLNYQIKGDFKVEAEIMCPVPLEELCVVGNVGGNGSTFEIGYSGIYNRFINWSIQSLPIVPKKSTFGEKLKFIAEIKPNPQYKSLYLDVEGGLFAEDNVVDNNFIGSTVQLFRLRTQYAFIGNAYWLKIYDEDILKFDLIPCIRNSDGKVGLYNLVDGNFYFSDNESFIAGGIE